MTLLNDLPQEILINILSYLTTRDLCETLVVSSGFYSLASYPLLWARTPINTIKVRCEGISPLLKLPRFSKIVVLDLSYTGFRDTVATTISSVAGCLVATEKDNSICSKYLIELFELIPKHPSLRELNMKKQDLCQVSPVHLIAEAVKGLIKVNLEFTRLTSLQSTVILSSSLSSSTLEDLNLAQNDLSKVLPELVAQAATRLKKINLGETWLTTEHCVFLLTQTISSANLTDLRLSRVDLAEVPASLLGEAVQRLEKVDLEATNLVTSELLLAVLRSVNASTTLRCLSLFIHCKVQQSRLVYQDVPPEVLAQAVSRLHKANLAFNKLSNDQCKAILTQSLKTLTLTNINLQDINLSKISPDLLAPAIARLRKVDLSSTKLTKEQCKALLNKCATSTTLKNMRLGMNNNISVVDPDTLARAVCRLDNVDICNNSLTTDQCTALLQQMVTSPTLQVVNLKLNLLSDVPVHLLAEALSRLKKVNLWGCRISVDHCTALFTRVVMSRKLRFINLGGYNVDNTFCYPEKLMGVDQQLIGRVKENVTIVYYPTGLHPRLW